MTGIKSLIWYHLHKLNACITSYKMSYLVKALSIYHLQRYSFISAQTTLRGYLLKCRFNFVKYYLFYLICHYEFVFLRNSLLKISIRTLFYKLETTLSVYLLVSTYLVSFVKKKSLNKLIILELIKRNYLSFNK